MVQYIKLKCTECGKFHYLTALDATQILPDGIKQGEAFQSKCPLCEDGAFSILAEDLGG